MPTLVANRQRYQAEGSAAVLTFTRPFYADTGVFTASGGSTQYPRGYYQAPVTAAYAVLGPEAYPKASLRFSLSSGSFSLAPAAASFVRGYILYCDEGSFLATGASNSIFLYARIIAPIAAYEADGPVTATGVDVEYVRGAFPFH